MMEVVQKVTFSIADGDVNPGKLFAGIFRFDGFRRMLLDNPVQLAVAAKFIGFNSAAWIKTLPGNVYNGIGSKIRHSFHLEIPARISRSALCSFLRSFRFCHHHDRCLAFTSPTSLPFVPAFSTIFGIYGGKESLVHFRCPGKSILLIPGTHGGSALFALKLFNRFHPIVFCTTTFSALYAHLEALLSKCFPAGLLVRELFDKLYKLHIQNFELKLRAHNVTYLRFDT